MRTKCRLLETVKYLTTKACHNIVTLEIADTRESEIGENEGAKPALLSSSQLVASNQFLNEVQKK